MKTLQILTSAALLLAPFAVAAATVPLMQELAAAVIPLAQDIAARRRTHREQQWLNETKDQS